MKLKFAILLIALGIISFFAYPRKHKPSNPTPIPTEEQTTKTLHESKRFIVKYSNKADQQLMSQFDSNNTAINFANSYIFTTEGYSLHYLYDRQTKQHLAGNKLYNKQDDLFCTNLDVVVSKK